MNDMGHLAMRAMCCTPALEQDCVAPPTDGSGHSPSRRFVLIVVKVPVMH